MYHLDVQYVKLNEKNDQILRIFFTVIVEILLSQKTGSTKNRYLKITFKDESIRIHDYT